MQDQGGRDARMLGDRFEACSAEAVGVNARDCSVDDLTASDRLHPDFWHFLLLCPNTG